MYKNLVQIHPNPSVLEKYLKNLISHNNKIEFTHKSQYSISDDDPWSIIMAAMLPLSKSTIQCMLVHRILSVWADFLSDCNWLAHGYAVTSIPAAHELWPHTKMFQRKKALQYLWHSTNSMFPSVLDRSQNMSTVSIVGPMLKILPNVCECVSDRCLRVIEN